MFIDTLNFAVQSRLTAGQVKTIKNELIATILNAGDCKAIRLIFYRNGKPERAEIYDYSNLDYPVFALVNMNKGRAPVTRIIEKHIRDTICQTDSNENEKQEEVLPGKEQKPGKESINRCRDRYIWLGIIVVLVLMLIRKKKR